MNGPRPESASPGRPESAARAAAASGGSPRAPRVPAGWAPALVLAAALCFAWAAWRAFGDVAAASSHALRIAVYDRSASVERLRPGYGAWLGRSLEEQRAAAAGEDADFAAIVFAGDRAWWVAPPGAGPAASRASSSEPPRLGRMLASDLSGALDLARDGARSRGVSRGRVVWFSDARTTAAGAREAIGRLAGAGFAVERGELCEPELADLELVELVAPESVEAGAPLACELRVRRSGGAAAERRAIVELTLLGDGVARLETTRGLDAGELEASWRFELGAAPEGGVLLEARTKQAGDPIPENDVARRFVASGGRLAVALVARDPALGERFLARAGDWPGIQFVPTSAAELGARLSDVRAVLSLDVDGTRLPADALASFVDAGGGWLDTAGGAVLRDERSGPATGTKDAREILPLAPDAPDRPERDVVLLLDGSGSMGEGAGPESGIVALRGALPRLLATVPRSDRLMAAWFAQSLEPAVVLRERGGAEPTAGELAAFVARRAPGGGTRIVGALEALCALREHADRAALVLLCSDGHEASRPTAAQLAALRARLAAAKIELSAIALGTGADQELLASLLPPGRSPVAVALGASGAAGIAGATEALAAALESSVVDERTRSRAALVAAAPDAFGEAGLARELAAALSPPPIAERVWLARAAPDADVLWRTAAGEPVLALRAVGAGAAASLASLPDGGWCADAADAAALAPLLRGLARRRPELARTELLEDGAVLVVRGLPADAPPRVLARLSGGAEAELVPWPLAGEDPRRTRGVRLGGAFPGTLLGELPGGVLELRGPSGEPLGVVSLPATPPAEFAARVQELPELVEAVPGDVDVPASGGESAAPTGGGPARKGPAGVAWLLSAGSGLLVLALLLGFPSHGLPSSGAPARPRVGGPGRA